MLAASAAVLGACAQSDARERPTSAAIAPNAPRVHDEVTLTAPAPALRAVRIANTGADPVQFRLTHNGHVAYTSLDQIVDDVKALPDEVADEPVERKIWRFVRDNVYHESPLNESTWLHASWPVLNSAGWGFCSHVSAIYVMIADRLGIRARIWNYGGHVAPEVFTGGAWHEYDPDLAVYYHSADGITIAGSEELQAHPELITSPVRPIFEQGQNDEAYRQELADIYSSPADNHVSDEFNSPEGFRGSDISLPAGASFVYPGKWTGPITGLDGTTPYTISQFREARLELPAGFTGMVEAPFLLRTVQGTGKVKVGLRTFDIGSDDLEQFLVDPGQSVTSVEVRENDGGVALVMLVNPLWFDFLPTTKVAVDGDDTSMLRIDAVDLPEGARPPDPVPPEVRKPVAHVTSL